MIDALSTTRQNSPTCSGVLSGAGGFYSCVDGKQVNLFFQSDISKVEARQVSSTVTSRVMKIQPPVVASSACTGEGTLRSSLGLFAFMTFVNTKNVPVKVYWLDYTGARVFRFDLAPNQSRVEPTFLSHPWVVTDASQSCLDIFVVQKLASTATIQ
jgi:hypothetical protein